jgi:hypothetical protein
VSVKNLAEELARETGWHKKEIYNLAIKIKEGFRGSPNKN